MEYYQKRSLQETLDRWKDEITTEKELNNLFNSYLLDLKKEIASFYAEYSQEEKMSLPIAQQLLTKSEQIQAATSISSLLEAFGPTNNPKLDAEIAKIRATTPINRLEALVINMQAKSLELAQKQEEATTAGLVDTYKTTYYKGLYNVSLAAGSASNFAILPMEAILAAIAIPYKGTFFSDAIWDNREYLVKQLRQSLVEGITKGFSYKKMSQLLAQKMDSSYKVALRLIRTETNKVMTEGAKASYENSGLLDSYQVLATLDGKTSKICQSQDLKIYKLSELTIGVNAPPFHPNCRSTIVPYFKDMGGTRISKDKNGNTVYVDKNLTYEQWFSTFGK